MLAQSAGLGGHKGCETSEGGCEAAQPPQLRPSGGLTSESETTKTAQLSRYGLRGGSEGGGSESDRTTQLRRFALTPPHVMYMWQFGCPQPVLRRPALSAACAQAATSSLPAASPVPDFLAALAALVSDAIRAPTPARQRCPRLSPPATISRVPCERTLDTSTSSAGTFKMRRRAQRSSERVESLKMRPPSTVVAVVVSKTYGERANE